MPKRSVSRAPKKSASKRSVRRAPKRSVSKRTVSRASKRSVSKRSVSRAPKRSVSKRSVSRALKKNLSKIGYSMLGGDEPFSFYLNITLYYGDSISPVKVSPTDKIKVVKQKIIQQQLLPQDIDIIEGSMKLFKDDEDLKEDEKEELKDELTVGHYNLENGQWVRLFFEERDQDFINEIWIRMTNRNKFENPAVSFCIGSGLPLPDEVVKRYTTRHHPNVYIFQTSYDEFKRILRGSRKGEKEYQDILLKTERMLLKRGLPSLKSAYGFIETGGEELYNNTVFIALSDDRTVALNYGEKDGYNYIYINENRYRLEDFIEGNETYLTYEEYNEEDDEPTRNSYAGDLPPGWMEIPYILPLDWNVKKGKKSKKKNKKNGKK